MLRGGAAKFGGLTLARGFTFSPATGHNRYQPALEHCPKIFFPHRRQKALHEKCGASDADGFALPRDSAFKEFSGVRPRLATSQCAEDSSRAAGQTNPSASAITNEMRQTGCIRESDTIGTGAVRAVREVGANNHTMTPAGYALSRDL